MCTVTVVTSDDGYCVAMNRDELLSRNDVFPPSQINVAGTLAIYPRDSASGTWVAANNHGISLALLNWNDVPQPSTEKTRSRGEVIPSLVGCASRNDLKNAIEQLDLPNVWPFRLVGVFAAEREIGEWRWNQVELASQSYEWKPRHWFSSSLSDERATAERGSACEAAWSTKDAGSVPWLRHLHASHENGPGPFSLCVHREKVGTLSYTEIECGAQTIECRYANGSPCRVDCGDAVSIARTR